MPILTQDQSPLKVNDEEEIEDFDLTKSKTTSSDPKSEAKDSKNDRVKFETNETNPLTVPDDVSETNPLDIPDVIEVRNLVIADIIDK